MTTEAKAALDRLPEAVCPNWPHPDVSGCSYCAAAEERGFFESRHVLARALERLERRVAAVEHEAEEALRGADLRYEATEASRDAERARADRLAALLAKTIYNPPGWTGPDVWWAKEARAALAEHGSPERTFPAGGSAVGQKNLSVAQPGRSRIMDKALAARLQTAEQALRDTENEARAAIRQGFLHQHEWVRVLNIVTRALEGASE